MRLELRWLIHINPSYFTEKMTTDAAIAKLDLLKNQSLQFYKNPAISEKFLTEFLNSCVTHPELIEPLPQGVLAVKLHLERLNLLDECKLFHVDSDYYEWSLEKRAYHYFLLLDLIGQIADETIQNYSQSSNDRPPMQKHTL